MGKKTTKSMSPAKRKAAAEASLLRKIKIEDEIKTLEVEVQKTEQDQLRIERDERELKVRKDGHKRLKEQNYRYKREINKLTGLNKFLAARNKDKITATVGDVKESSTILHKLNERIAKRKTEARHSLDAFQNSFVYLLSKNKCTEDMIALHFDTKDATHRHRQVDVEREKNRKNKLLNELETVRNSLQVLLRIESERRNESKSQTMEDYMDAKRLEFKTEIQSLSEQMKSVNKELAEISSLVDERSAEVASMKRAINQIPKKNIEDSEEYGKVLARNKALQEQLDKYLKRRDEVAAETRNVLNQIEDEKRRTSEEAPSEVAVQKLLQLLEEDIKSRLQLEGKDQAIIDELKIQNRIRDDYITKMAQVSVDMKKDCLAEYEKLQALKAEVNRVGNENKLMLDVITQSSQRVLSSVVPSNSY